jgi:hypothetical protein
MKNTKVFLMLYVYSDTKIYQILTVYRNQSVESKYVCTYCVTTYLEKVQVSYQ